MKKVLNKTYKRSPVFFQKAMDPLINFTRFQLNYHFFMPEFPRHINLSLSSSCQAKCIFCPEDRGKEIHPKFMPYHLATTICDQLSERAFSGRINLGENGEAVLNPDFIHIFEYINKNLPNICLQLASNMNRVDEALARKMLKNGLDELHFNIDGATKKTYEFAKRLPFETMKKNVQDFFRIRDELKSNCKVIINIVTAARYLKEVAKVESELAYDAEEIISYWKPFLRPYDTIQELRPFWWARRDQLRIPNKIGCALLPRVVKELFIAANGDCYVCCLDHNDKISFGNLNQSSIGEIWKGKRRKEILKYLFLKNFEELGEPCSICLY